jgi:hypothetical protein
MNAATKQQIVSDSYRSPVMDALKVQIFLAILCVLMLDGGYMAKLCGIALAAHWVGILLAMFRRPFTPTNADLRFIRWGFLGLFVPLLILQGALW